MSDLTQNLIPYGLLKEHYPEVAKELEECGGPWEFHCDGEWLDINSPSWDDAVVYRLAANKPSIDWSHVSDRFNALATGSAGFTHLYSRRPEPNAHGWFGGDIETVEPFASYVPGTCDWRDSLVMRPGYEEKADD
jgi:hypothetical protein